MAARQNRPTVRLADNAPAEEAPPPVEAVDLSKRVETTVVPQQVAQPEPAPQAEPVAPAPPPLSPPPALSIALSNGPAPAKTSTAPVLRVAKGRQAPAPVTPMPTDTVPASTSPASDAASGPSVAAASKPATAVKDSSEEEASAASAVALSEAKSDSEQDTAPTTDVNVPPRETPAVARTPDVAPRRPLPQHWPQPMSPSARARDAAGDLAADQETDARPPAATSSKGAASSNVAGLTPPAPRKPSAASAGREQASAPVPAVVSAPQRPTVAAVARPKEELTAEAAPAAETTAKQPAPVVPSTVAQKQAAGQNPPPAAAAAMAPVPRPTQPVVQSRAAAGQMPPVRAVASPPPSSPSTTTAAEASQQLAMISNRAGEHIEYAFNLAERGALFSAEAEFTQGLVLIAQALDAQHRTQAHSMAVTAGLRALREADDFMPRGGQTLVHVEDVIGSHKTPVWQNVRPEQVPPLVAMQRYYAYAQQQFTISGMNVPAAAMALYGLGRLQSTLAAEDSVKKMTAGPKAMALYRATLDIDPNNYLAANELGVLYGRYGQWPEAEASLRRSIAIAPRTENWHNLADVLERMGNTAGAAQARQQEQLAKNSGNRPGWQTSADRVPLRYVDPETFIKASAGADPDQLATVEAPKASEATGAAAAPAADAKTAKKSYGWFGDKLAEGAARVSRPAKPDPEMVR
ncbi:MAG TPA: hypothetical protein VHD36_13275 [Pirellulales bacterium]|nr:hypothetical protein [Pirellulales bacterium]